MMATSKVKSEKTTGAKKSATGVKAVRKQRISTLKSVPGEDEIRNKAQEIYYERVTRGESGSAEDDWLKAEKILKG